ncbi:MAG: sigR 1 [Gemmataceae bacterium]|nr:sigR 1 [Gemmataceae bacterium]
MLQDGIIDEFVIDEVMLERCREYLRAQSGRQLAPHLRCKLDVSDVVQQTLLTAHEKMPQFRGRSESELFGWLRQILRNHIAAVGRRFRAAARDVARERPLIAGGSESSGGSGAGLAAGHSTPSQRFARQDQLRRLTEALAQLPNDQRLAVELHHLKGCTVAQVAENLDRSKAAVVGLLFRGMGNLRRLLDDLSTEE